MSLFETSGTSSQVNNWRLLVEASAIREMIKKDQISIWWIERTKQLSGELTNKWPLSYLLTETV